jgi:hypothetical protein
VKELVSSRIFWLWVFAENESLDRRGQSLAFPSFIIFVFNRFHHLSFEYESRSLNRVVVKKSKFSQRSRERGREQPRGDEVKDDQFCSSLTFHYSWITRDSLPLFDELLTKEKCLTVYDERL